MMRKPRPGPRAKESGKDKMFNGETAGKMKIWMESMKNMIQGGKYLDAYYILTAPGSAFQNEFNVTVKFKIQDLKAEQCAKLNLYDQSNRTLNLVVSKNDDWLNDKKEAIYILPMYLEEYMHHYHSMTGEFLSPRTGEYKGSYESPEEAKWHEIDVMAQFHDWGFKEEDIGYADRYDDRKQFLNWSPKDKT